MPKRGEVRVRLCRRWCAAIAGLMTELAEREQSPSWLMSEDTIEAGRMKAIELGRIMRKAAIRKRRSTGFTVNIDRELVLYFAKLYIRFHANIDEIRRAQIAFQIAEKTRRGPNKLTGQSLADRAEGKIQRNLEHTLRLKRRLRFERASDIWYRKLEARGETILTTTVPSPKF